MYITWLGHACFKIQTKNGTIITDPYDKKVGLSLSRVSGDIVTISHDHYDHNNADAINGDPFIIDAPGEYEVKGVSIRGIRAWHDDQEGAERGPNTIFVYDVEDVRMVHLGDLGTKLTDEQLSELNNIDVVMIPVGSTYTINAKEAAAVVNQIEPRIIIPMHYKIPKLTIKLDGVEPFCKEMGVQKNGAEDKLKITKKDLPTDESHVIILKP